MRKRSEEEGVEEEEGRRRRRKKKGGKEERPRQKIDNEKAGQKDGIEEQNKKKAD